MAIFNLTKKADYSLIMLAEMTRVGKGGLVSVSNLCRKHGLPRAFLAQIGRDLAKAGIVGAKEGRGGGYYLLQEPTEIKVKTALEAVAGKVAPAVCVMAMGHCPLEDGCEQKGFMVRLSDQMEEMLANYTLVDLV